MTAPHVPALRPRWFRPLSCGPVLLAVTLSSAAATAAAQTPSGLGGMAGGAAQGYLGLSVGKTGFDPDCRPGFGCDDSDTGFKIAAGALGADIWGVEISYIDLGKIDASGGSQEASGLTLSGIASLPFTPAFSAFAKLGVTYARTKTSAIAAGVSTGSENGFGVSYGAGLAYAINAQLSAVAEYEQYRIKFAPGSQTLDFVSIGVRYRF